MRTTTVLTLVCTMMLAACGGSDSGEAGQATTSASTSSAPETTAAAPATTAAAPDTTAASSETAGGAYGDTTAAQGGSLTVAETDLGSILVDGEGLTLYLFLPDDQGPSTCYDQCADNWPALTGELDAGEGVDAALLGTTERDDGSTQVTYNGWPLYYFINDVAAGDVNGQGVNDVWWVLDPTGNAVGAG